MFTTSLYEINHHIDYKHWEDISLSNEPDLQEVMLKVLLKCYHNYTHVFSKKASDILPPYRSYDLKIELTELNSLSFSLLYKQSLKELEVTKQYLLDNLNKDFIIPS